jgi:hypothetical protein
MFRRDQNATDGFLRLTSQVEADVSLSIALVGILLIRPGCGQPS